MATPIAHFISLEVPGSPFPSRGAFAVIRETAIVAVLPVISVVHMSAEIIWAMKPRAGTDEDTPTEPFRTVITIRGTAIRPGVIVTVRTRRSASDADIETDLSRCLGSGWRDGDHRNRG